jgi:hypothetical protein
MEELRLARVEETNFNGDGVPELHEELGVRLFGHVELRFDPARLHGTTP